MSIRRLCLSGETASITFNITDYIRDATDESKVFLNDQFTLYYREAAARRGAGEQLTEGELRIAQWELGADKGRINIIESNKTIRVNFDTALRKSLARTWRVAYGLGSIYCNPGYLTLCYRPLLFSNFRPCRYCYVQFAASSNELTAEEAGPEFATGLAAHNADTPQCSPRGGAHPIAASPNWSQTIPLPALSGEFAALAEQCTVALLDTHHIESPDCNTLSGVARARIPAGGVTRQPDRLSSSIQAKTRCLY